MHYRKMLRRRAIVVVAAIVSLAVGATAYATVRGGTSGPISADVTPATAQSAIAGSGGTISGQTVQAKTYTAAPEPTAAQLAALNAGLAEENVPAPNRNTVNTDTNPGPAVPSPDSPINADSDYKRFALNALPVASIPQGTTYSSFVNEPSVGDSGSKLMMTGNWYAAFSTARGSGSWTFLDPFTLFGSGFCCDQVTLYDKTHDHMYWLLQYSDHLTIANAPSGNLGSWCYYNFYPTTIGQASDTALDFNDAMIGTKDLYFTTNIFPSAGGYGSSIVRVPLEGMNSCGSVGYNYYSQLDSFTWRLVQGSNDRAYWGSDWDPTGARPNGTSFRLFWWDESSGSIFWNNYTIDAFAFYTRNSGQNCSSQDGVVKNWCQYADSRTLGAYRANGTIGFSMNASQGGFATFPYTVREYFRESDLAYLGHSNLYCTTCAIQFLSLSPNSKGHVGGTYSWGGGTASTHYFPGTAALVDDDITPNQPWTNDFFQAGGGNTCTYGGIYRWGDYLTTRPADASDTLWVGTGFKETGGCGVSGTYTRPVLLFFGRTRDTGDYARWH